MKSLRMTDEMAKMLKIDAAEPFKEPPRRKSLTFADVKRNETLKAKPATEMTIEKAQVDKVMVSRDAPSLAESSYQESLTSHSSSSSKKTMKQRCLEYLFGQYTAQILLRFNPNQIKEMMEVGMNLVLNEDTTDDFTDDSSDRVNELGMTKTPVEISRGTTKKMDQMSPATPSEAGADAAMVQLLQSYLEQIKISNEAKELTVETDLDDGPPPPVETPTPDALTVAKRSAIAASKVPLPRTPSPSVDSIGKRGRGIRDLLPLKLGRGGKTPKSVKAMKHF